MADTPKKISITIEYDGTSVSAKFNKKTSPNLLGGLLFLLSKPKILHTFLTTAKEVMPEQNVREMVEVYSQCVQYDRLLSENDIDWMKPVVPAAEPTNKSRGSEGADDDE